MTVWETEDEGTGPTGPSLPTPNDTPYRTPSTGSRRSATPPGRNSTSSPIPAPDRNSKASKRSSKDVSNDESISVLDPRRFTPTLHANLVAEILNLRRDQEEKIKLIESLETSLHTSQEEQESLQESVVKTTKEGRSLKRQLALLEGGTSSALSELARERDNAVDSISETRKRLEVAQRKIRSHEEDSQRAHDLWTREKDSWEEEKRKYERKIHVAESRLKVVLDEVAAYQEAHVNGQCLNGAESEGEELSKDGDAASVRTMSMTGSIRFPTASPGKGKNNTLADELDLDGDDDWTTDGGGRESALSYHRHTRTWSRDSVMSKMHRRNQSHESIKRPGSIAKGRLWMNSPVLETLEDGPQDAETVGERPSMKAAYTDTGVQFSPPPSPKMLPSKPTTPEPSSKFERVAEAESPPRADEIEANQRRKRIQLNKPLAIEPPARSRQQMISAGSQTVDEPLSPPKTPQSPFRSVSPPHPEESACEMVSASTQTDVEDDTAKQPRLSKTGSPPILPVPPIPSISVIPPTSRPTTPREPLLPQYTKDVGCQVSLVASGGSAQSIGVQTEEIRIDQRLGQLPAHLRPETVSSRPPSPNPQMTTTDESSKNFTPIPSKLPPRNPKRLETKRSLTGMASPTASPAPPISPTFSGSAIVSHTAPANETTHDAYPGNNDDGPLSTEGPPMRRPHRISSLFAGFDANSSDEADDFDADLSDSEYRTALTAPGHRPKTTVVRPSKRRTPAVVTAPEQTELRHSVMPRSLTQPLDTDSHGYKLGVAESISEKDEQDGPAQRPVMYKSRTSHDKSTAGPNSKPSAMRKAALIQSGIASHQGRPGSPGLPEPRDPPFPIPTRASSRRPPISASAPSDGQRSPTRGQSPWHRRGSSRSHYRANSIRKVRSAAALPRNQRHKRHGSRSPPPFSETTEAPESPGLPPLPSNDITTPRQYRERSRSRFKSSHRSQPSTNTAVTNQTGTTDPTSTNGGTPSTGVVDAIAQTMVGEWMFKYVRRRKSFGVPESTGKDENSNDRHKRWVWLAPYERSILWSSKQPSSGSALMGKTGRKLIIQSVLDVKDENPGPKGSTGIFNRSILILTPQRALKFTATSADRHYIWLTALSFLAHSQQAVPEVLAAPQLPAASAPNFEIGLPPPQPKKRAGIRDSIRLTKSRAPATKQSAPPSANGSQPATQLSQLDEGGDVQQQQQQPEAFPPLPDINGFHQQFPPVPEPNINQSHQRERSGDAATPPSIPRFHERANQAMVHGRKRSNTGGHVPPPLSFRGFSGPPSSTVGSHSYTNSNAGNSVGTAGSSDVYFQSHQSQPSSGGGGPASWGIMSNGGYSLGSGAGGAPSQRTSEASSSRPSNFFDAIGTVRMEAFISPLGYPAGGFGGDHPDEHEEFRYRARRRSKELRRRASRSRHRDRDRDRDRERDTDSYLSRGTRGTASDDFYGGGGGSRTAGEEDFFRDDPFRGF